MIDTGLCSADFPLHLGSQPSSVTRKETMPLYDYKCTDCGITRTITLSIKAEDFVMKCVCEKPMIRIYTAPAITFKGTGFYRTDK